jgi:hypothetical protein
MSLQIFHLESICTANTFFTSSIVFLMAVYLTSSSSISLGPSFIHSIFLSFSLSFFLSFFLRKIVSIFLISLFPFFLFSLLIFQGNGETIFENTEKRAQEIGDAMHDFYM